MTFLNLDERYRSLQQDAAALAERLAPIAIEADNSNELHDGVVDLVRDSGLMSLMVPAEFAGNGYASQELSLDPVAVCIVREALMGECSHADSLFALQGIGSFAITRGGTEEQRKEWLPRGRAPARCWPHWP